MDPITLLLLNTSDEEESEINNNLRVVRRQLRDKSNPLSLPTKAFIKRFRLNKEAFNHVLILLNLNHRSSTAVSPVLQLSAMLSLLGSGGFQHTVGNDYLIGLSQTSVSTITENLSTELEKILCPIYIKFEPMNSEACKQWFVEKFKIPGVVGCIDGTHFALQKPVENEHMFFNRKGFHSLNSMIICDHKYKITSINSKYGGCAHDSFIWKQSEEMLMLEEKFKTGLNKNSWVLGDCGYPLEPWCMTPYRSPDEFSAESNFNEVHSKARCIVERTIGILKSRWKILIHGKRGRYSPEKMARFSNVCSALHNICIIFKIPNPNVCNHFINIHPQIPLEDDSNLKRLAQKTREQIKISLLNS